MADNGSGVGTGMIAGILLVIVIIAVGALFATGKLNFDGGKDVNVKVEMPKTPELPKAAKE
jgi:hypothetical protein